MSDRKGGATFDEILEGLLDVFLRRSVKGTMIT